MTICSALTLCRPTSIAGQLGVDTIITDAERKGFTVDPDSIRHSLFRLAIPNPGASFEAIPDLQRNFQGGSVGQPSILVWGVRDSPHHKALLLLVTKMGTLDEAAFRRFAKGVREGITRSTLLNEHVTWSDSGGEYLVTMKNPNGLYFAVRCISGQRGAGALVACAETITEDLTALESVRSGLHFTTAGP